MKNIRSRINGIMSGWDKNIARYPQRQLLVGYGVYAFIGSILLLLPIAQNCDIPAIDNIFTAISALSTTGLATVDVAKDYTFFGQLVVLLLIQLGGFGYMTLTTYVMSKITHRLGTNQAKLINAQFAFPSSMDTRNMLSNIINFTLIIEICGIIALYPYFLATGAEQPLWSAIFHTISAFCTAGFSIYSDNLMRFATDNYVNVVITALSYMGAMGFIVMTDLLRKITRKNHRITFTTRIIVLITGVMTIWSTAHLFFFEPTLSKYGIADRFMISLFHAVSAMSTAGFNTVNVGAMVPISLLILSVTMYIGASPSGTGGGLKSTTLSAIIAYTKNKLGLRKDISLMGSNIPEYRVETALTTFVFYTFLLFIGVYLIALFEPSETDFLKIVFETSSALATTGLSSGILSGLTPWSKITLMALMFIGRVGIITMGNVMFMRTMNRRIHKSADLAV